MELHEYDFAGLVTKFDVKCSDGRVITHGAFSHQIGQSSLVVNRLFFLIPM